MNTASTAPTLTAEQQQALDAHDGILQGESFVLMRPDVVLEWFGYDRAALEQELRPAFDEADRGELAAWNLDEFLAEMHRRAACE
ncbi:MAG: hypothetical protein WD066_05250 [Planctomycetaceae bacterium]